VSRVQLLFLPYNSPAGFQNQFSLLLSSATHHQCMLVVLSCLLPLSSVFVNNSTSLQLTASFFKSEQTSRNFCNSNSYIFRRLQRFPSSSLLLTCWLPNFDITVLALSKSLTKYYRLVRCLVTNSKNGNPPYCFFFFFALTAAVFLKWLLTANCRLPSPEIPVTWIKYSSLSLSLSHVYTFLVMSLMCFLSIIISDEN
jgi:hypothetical protein